MKKLKKRKKGERDMFLAKLNNFRSLPLAKNPHETLKECMECELREASKMQQPPPGTDRRVASDGNEIIVWPNGDLTIVGDEARRLVNSLASTRFRKSIDPVTVKDTTYLLRIQEPCPDAALRVEQMLMVEANLMGAILDWPHFTVGVIPIRLSCELDVENDHHCARCDSGRKKV